MTPERWEGIVSLIKEKFDIEDSGTYELDPGPGEVEYYDFRGPMGLMRVEWVTKPKMLGKHVIASKRIGSMATEKIVYSDDEEVNFFRAYRYNNERQDWEEIENQNMFS